MIGFKKSKNKSTQYCPSCDGEILTSDINIREGVALCSHCGELSHLSDLNYTGMRNEERLANPPKHSSIKSDQDSARISISLFSLPRFFAMLFACIFWNSIVSIFLNIAITSVCYHIFGYIPNWLPTVISDAGNGIDNLGMTIFLCLFLTPFVIIGILLLISVLLSLFGSIRIILSPEKSSISTGFTFLRWKKVFDPNQVSSISIEQGKLSNENDTRTVIQIEAQKTIRFGSDLSEHKKEWLVAVLKAILSKKNTTTISGQLPHLYWIKN